jgi:MFS family permease
MVYATRPLVSLYATSMGAGTIQVGILVSAFSFLPFLFSIQIGKLSDRIGDKIPTIIGTFGLFLGMMVPVIYPSMFSLFLSQALVGISQIFIHVNLQNLIGVLSMPKDRDTNYSHFSLAVGIGGVLGPAMGGYLAEHMSFSFTYLVSTTIGLLPIFLGFQLPAIKRKLTSQNIGSNSKSSSLDLLRIPELQKALLVSALVLYSRDLYVAYFPLYASSLNYNISQIGAVLSIQGIILVAVRWFLPTLVKKLGRQNVLYLTLLFAGVSFVLTPFFTKMHMFFILAALMGIGLGCGQPLSMTTTYNASPESRTAEALGIRLAISRLSQVIAPLLFGFIGTYGGISLVFYLSGALLFGGSYAMAKKKKERIRKNHIEAKN